MSSRLTCVLIGRGPQMVACATQLLSREHRVLHVVSDCSQVAAWAQKHGVDRIDPQDDLTAALGGEPFDYLFSIVNHAVTPDAVLAMPRLGAINYHDSLLPAYSGFHATTWSILDGQSEHGITWHRMTKEVDAGPYLLQKSFPVTEQDTAFTLAARASELANRSFVELLTALETDAVTETASQPAQNFHRKSERPGCAVFDWNKSADELLRMARALDFGNEDNWLTRAKLQTPTGVFLCVGSATAAASTGAAPGTLGRGSADTITVEAVGGALTLSGLTTLEGVAVTVAQLSHYGMDDGCVMPSPAAELVQAAESLDQQVTGSERFWVRRLQSLCAPQLHELKAHAASGEIAKVDVVLPSALQGVGDDDRQAMLVAALAVYAARTNDDVRTVDLPLRVSTLQEQLAGLYAQAVPVSVAVDTQASWDALQRSVREGVQAAKRRGTYARDVWTRYAGLRNKSASDREAAIAVTFDDASSDALPIGVKLLVRLAPDSNRIELQFDTGAIGALHAERIGARVAHLMAAGAAAADTAVGTLSMVPESERTLLLDAFQQTHRDDVHAACIHDLFAAQVQRTPDQPAIVFRDEGLTYRELDERANKLANHLVELGVGPDRMVAIAIERSLDMIVGLLAILKAGGAYVPLDPSYPTERLAMMLEDSGAQWLLTQRHLRNQLPPHNAKVLLVDEELPASMSTARPTVAVTPANLAYVIFTSGSTGRPKGVMVEHGNVANFFAGMDDRVGPEAGIWLAVTSISFDISVLEIFWTLCRGFETVIQEEGDKASMLKSQTVATDRPMGFGLFYFAADSTAATKHAYRLMLEGAKYADENGFVAVWTPERHFHAFGGLYPNAAVTSAAIAAVTENVELRAGSVVIPLHDPIRVAEEWAVVDNLSQGRVGLSFASGWHVNDFVLQPGNYETRREVMQESIDTVLKLWAGEKIKVPNGAGEEIEVSVLPRPIREKPPMWLASAGNIETFRIAGRAGYNVLTNMLGQDIDDLGAKFAAYREARRESGHDGDGIISVMLHTFVTDSDDKAKELARGPFGNYLTTSYDLVKVAPWMFPAFKQPSVTTDGDAKQAFDPERFDDDDMAALLDHAFDRYFDTAGLFGTPQRALKLIEKLKDIGATEVACLIDFGIDQDTVLENLEHLNALRELANPATQAAPVGEPVSIREQFQRRQITHFQCTPSLARILIADDTLGAMKSLRKFLVGGEALTSDLAQKVLTDLPQVDLINMYGPTETTIWSSTAAITKDNAASITIGRPIANTQIRILDRELQLMPLGTPGELCIGGDGVVRGYLDRPELTADRFVPDPFREGNRIYRTGDLARFADDGTLEYLGRLDQQVKFNGYRIELGEIETVLQKHPAVQQAVVAVKEGASQSQLVGYVLPAGGAGDEQAAGDTSDWQQRWDTAYATRSGAQAAPARCNTAGWLSSYTGEAIPAAAMREWLEETTTRIRELRPQRVLEIGCGTGMILYSCLEHVAHYTALDVSPVALESIRNELSEQERRKVTLRNQAADQLEEIADNSCDVVIINSVAQYFPSADYLTRVLAQAARVLSDGGALFLGDVRCLEAADAFHTMVELHKAPGQTPAAQLAERVAERKRLDTELLLSEGFFANVTRDVPRLHLESMQTKRGAQATEMRDFRFDAVLRAGTATPTLDMAAARQLAQPATTADISQALAESPALLHVVGATDRRLRRVMQAVQAIASGDRAATAESLSASLEQPGEGIDQDELRGLHPDYDVEIRFGDAPGSFDALLRHRQDAPPGVWLPTVGDSAPVASTPHKRLGAEDVSAKLRPHLQEFLPDYMVPQAFVMLESLPLTPNGKIDRKALPDPVEKPKASKAEYAVPGSDLERTIAKIWQGVLDVERVGRKDNIFDLGASSLLTVEANSQLQQVLGQKIPLVTMFRYPTIESLAGHLDTSESSPAANEKRQDRMAAAAARRREARSRNSRT